MSTHKQKGLTIVELLIASALGLIIILGVMQIFRSNVRAFTLAESSSRVQENGRYAIDFLTTALRAAGNFGCVPSYAIQNGNVQQHVGRLPAVQAELGISVASILPATLDGAPVVDWVPRSDELVVLSTVGDGIPVQSVRVNNEAQREFSLNMTGIAQSGIDAGDLLLVGTCEVADIFIAAGDDNAQNLTVVADATGGVRDNYSINNTPIHLYPLQRQRFHVNADGVLMCDGCQGRGSVDLPIVDGIESLQFLYGVDIDSDFIPDLYAPYSTLNNAQQNNIVAVQLSVLTNVLGQNNQAVTTEPQPFVFMGQRFQPPAADRRLRRAFETTVTLRNGVQ